MIIGAHSIIYSKDADADRAFLKEVLGLPYVDAGHGWLIFGLPPAEVAVHPSGQNDVQEFYLMTGDVQALVARMNERGIETAPITDQRWGMLTQVTLPGGGKLGVYQPRHASPPPHAPRKEGASKRSRGAPASHVKKKAARSRTKKSRR